MVGHLLQKVLGEIRKNIPGFYHINGPVFLSLQKHFGKFVWQGALYRFKDPCMDLKPIYMTYSMSPQKIQQKNRSIPISNFLNPTEIPMIGNPNLLVGHFCFLSGIKWPWRCLEMPHGVGVWRRCADATWRFSSRVLVGFFEPWKKPLVCWII